MGALWQGTRNNTVHCSGVNISNVFFLSIYKYIPNEPSPPSLPPSSPHHYPYLPLLPSPYLDGHCWQSACLAPAKNININLVQALTSPPPYPQALTSTPPYLVPLMYRRLCGLHYSLRVVMRLLGCCKSGRKGVSCDWSCDGHTRVVIQHIYIPVM